MTTEESLEKSHSTIPYSAQAIPCTAGNLYLGSRVHNYVCMYIHTCAGHAGSLVDQRYSPVARPYRRVPIGQLCTPSAKPTSRRRHRTSGSVPTAMSYLADRLHAAP